VTASTHQPLTITRLDRDKWNINETIDGQGLAYAAIGFTAGLFDGLSDDDANAAGIAWDRVVDEAIAEISPQVRDLLYAALARRLPWTWAP
jgi:hypothetical protein